VSSSTSLNFSCQPACLEESFENVAEYGVGSVVFEVFTKGSFADSEEFITGLLVLEEPLVTANGGIEKNLNYHTSRWNLTR